MVGSAYVLAHLKDRLPSIEALTDQMTVNLVVAIRT